MYHFQLKNIPTWRCEFTCRALLQCRNTPSRKDGLSPVQKLYGHPIKDILPAHRKSFASKWQQSLKESAAKTEATVESSRKYYNTTTHPLCEVSVGTNIAIQNHQSRLWDTYGIVTAIGPQRQYHVKTSRGNILIRNQRFIQRRVATLVPYLKNPIESGPEKVEVAQPRKPHWQKKPTQCNPSWP